MSLYAAIIGATMTPKSNNRPHTIDEEGSLSLFVHNSLSPMGFQTAYAIKQVITDPISHTPIIAIASPLVRPGFDETEFLFIDCIAAPMIGMSSTRVRQQNDYTIILIYIFII